MTEDLEEEEGIEEAPSRFAIPTWKKVLLGCAVLSVLFGLSLRVFGGSGEGETEVSRSGGAGPNAPQATSILPRTESPSGTETETEAEVGVGEWSPFFVKGGLSLFVGFCVGFALRAFFKISAIAVGVLFLVLIGLERVDFVEIHWDVLSQFYDGAVARLSDEFESFRGFVTGSLPSAGLGGVGLFAGFKGNR